MEETAGEQADESTMGENTEGPSVLQRGVVKSTLMEDTTTNEEDMEQTDIVNPTEVHDPDVKEREDTLTVKPLNHDVTMGGDTVYVQQDQTTVHEVTKTGDDLANDTGAEGSTNGTLLTQSDSEWCSDQPPGWYDSRGSSYNCRWYAVDNRCHTQGSGYSRLGKTATQACCNCGGGFTTKSRRPALCLRDVAFIRLRTAGRCECRPKLEKAWISVQVLNSRSQKTLGLAVPFKRNAGGPIC